MAICIIVWASGVDIEYFPCGSELPHDNHEIRVQLSEAFLLEAYIEIWSPTLLDIVGTINNQILMWILWCNLCSNETQVHVIIQYWKRIALESDYSRTFVLGYKREVRNQ